jgi:uncharacterized protein (DUF1697 family)
MRYVALLRALNVGGQHVVKMDALKAHFEAAGLANVKTFIASGNVLFDSPRKAAPLEAHIEKHLRAALGYEVVTFLRSAAEIDQTAGHDPFGAEPRGNRYVGFLKDPLSAKGKSYVIGFKGKLDDFAFAGREIHWLCGGGSMESEFEAGRMEKTLGIRATFRNLNTVRKLAKLANPG